MDNSSDAVLIKQGRCSSEIVCRLARSSGHFLWLRNKNYFIRCRITQGTRWRQAFVCRTNDGRVTGHFVSICNEKHGKEAKTKDLASLKKAAFLASFADKDHQNRNFMVSNTIVILLLLG